MSDTDDDGDDVAIDDGMEPESPTGAGPGGGDDDDAYDDGDEHVATGGAVSRTVDAPRGTREISAKTRELAKQIAAANKGKGGGDPNDLPGDDDIDYDEAPTGAPITPGSAAPPAPAGKPGVDPAATPAPTPPAPALDPEVTRLREDYARRMTDLDAREQEIAARERSGDLAQLEEQYFERGAPAIVELLKKWEGADGEQLKDALADLVSDLTIHMGVEVPQEVKDRLEAKRTRKQVQRMRAEQGKQAERTKAEQEAAQEEQTRVRVKAALSQEIAKPEHAQTYPWLAAEPTAGEIVFDVVQAVFKKDGTRITWQEAAKRANDYLKEKGAEFFDKRRHLLTAANGQAAQAGGQQPRTQGGQQVRRSQAQPQTPPPAPPPAPDPNQKWDPEAHRKAVKAKYRNAFKPQEE